jgi:hypothetical protein
MALPAKSTTKGITKSEVKEIAEEHRKAQEAFGSAVQHAIRCGELLTGAKEKVKHGEWLPWLEENFDFTRQTASGYMRLATAAERGELEGAPSISGALKQLAPQKGGGDNEGRLERAKELIEKAEASQREAASEVVAAATAELAGLGITTTKVGLDFPEGLSIENWLRAGEIVKDLLAAVGAEGLSPAARWQLEESLGSVLAGVRIERFWLEHQGPASSEKIQTIRESCEDAGVMPMIEDLTSLAEPISYVWVGYVAVDRDALQAADSDAAYAAAVEDPLTYHPGWADFCRERLGVNVRFATEELMPRSPQSEGEDH